MCQDAEQAAKRSSDAPRPTLDVRKGLAAAMSYQAVAKVKCLDGLLPTSVLRTVRALADLTNDHSNRNPFWRPQDGDCTSPYGYVMASEKNLLTANPADRQACRRSRNLLLLLGIVTPGTSRLSLRLSGGVSTKSSPVPILEWNWDRLTAGDLDWVKPAALAIRHCLARKGEISELRRVVETMVPARMFWSDQWRDLLIRFVEGTVEGFPHQDFMLNHRWTARQIEAVRAGLEGPDDTLLHSLDWVETSPEVPRSAASTAPQPQESVVDEDMSDEADVAAIVRALTTMSTAKRARIIAALQAETNPEQAEASHPDTGLSPGADEVTPPVPSAWEVPADGVEPDEDATPAPPQPPPTRRPRGRRTEPQPPLVEGPQPSKPVKKRTTKAPKYPEPVSRIGGEWVKACSEGRVSGLGKVQFEVRARNMLYQAIASVWNMFPDWQDEELLMSALREMGQATPTARMIEIAVKQIKAPRRTSGAQHSANVSRILAEGSARAETEMDRELRARIIATTSADKVSDVLDEETYKQAKAGGWV